MKKQYIKSKGLFILLGVIGLSSLNIYSQARNTNKQKPTVKGVVVDEFNNPLSGVVINVNGESIGTISEPDGEFQLAGVYDPKSELSFSMLGYKTVVIEKGNEKQLYVKMTPDVSLSDQVISTSLGNRTRLSVTQAIATVTGDELSKTHHHTLGAALAGRLPGLIVRTGGNEPGNEGFTLNVRGTSTSTGRTPLILIDGMVVDKFSHLNPKDVESVNIYKDAAATALYGMQGGNGVISIVTKRGKLSKPSISINANYTMQNAIKTPTMLSSAQYATLVNEAYKNDGYGDNYMYSPDDIEAYKNGSNPDLYPNNNWYDMFVKPFVQTQNVDVAATGGSKYFKYYTSLGYMHQDSPFETDGTNVKDYGIHRFYVRSNVDVTVNDFITGFMNVAARIDRNTITNADGGTSGVLSSIFQLAPNIYGPLTPDGQVIVTPQFTNPTYARINRSGYRRQLGTDITANIGLNFDLSFITKGLSASGEAKFYTNALSNIHGQTDYERWTRDLTQPDKLEFFKYGASEYKPITLSKGVSYSYMSEFDVDLNYKRQFDIHGVGANAFWNYQYNNPAGSVIQPYVRMTYGLSASYSLSNIFYLDVLTSIQGSEQFMEGSRYGFFPAVSGAWIISNMDFMEKTKDVLSFLKLRASYGVTGNDQINDQRFLYKDNIKPGGAGYIGQLGNTINENRIANPFITWEKNRVANIGLEFSLFNQFMMGIDLFNEDRIDILTTTNNIPASLGIPGASLPYVNKGHITNKGIDLFAAYKKDISKDWTIGVNGNISFNKNKIKELNELYLGDDYAYPYRNKGYSVGQLWGYEIDYSNGNGYFNSQEEITKSGLTYEGQAPRPGDFIYVDQNGDDIIDEKDQKPFDDTSIPAFSWGAGFDLRWKNLDISVLFQGLGGYAQFMSGLGFYETANQGMYFENHLNAWTAERYKNGEYISAPALSNSTTASHKANNYYYQDRTFARLKNVEIGYTLPYKFFKNTLCKELRIYASGINLLTFDKMKSNDLDVEMSAIDAFPVSRYFTVGLNVTF